MGLASALVTIKIAVQSAGQGDAAGGPSANLDWTKRLTDGVGENASNRNWYDRRTLAASGTDTHNLRSITDNAGNSSSSAGELRGIMINVPGRTAAGDLNATGLTLKAAASNGSTAVLNGATDSLIVNRGGCFVWTSPADGTATISSSLRDIVITNTDSSAALEYEIVLLIANG